MFISPSVASCNLLEIGKEVDFAYQYFPDLHLDLEDGYATQGISFGMKLSRMLKKAYPDFQTSVHLEIYDPIRYLNNVKELNPAIVFIQIDTIAEDKMLDTIMAFKNEGLRVGISLSSRDDGFENKKCYDDCLKQAEEILVCTNVVGDPTASFAPRMLKMALEQSEKYNIPVWLDGGVKWEMMPELLKHPNIKACVMGRGLFFDKEASLIEAKKYGLLKEN